MRGCPDARRHRRPARRHDHPPGLAARPCCGCCRRCTPAASCSDPAVELLRAREVVVDGDGLYGWPTARSSATYRCTCRARLRQPRRSTPRESRLGDGRRACLSPTFAAGYPFALDDYQVDGLRACRSRSGVLVAAPTGAGKTVVGEFAVHLALRTGPQVLLHHTDQGAQQPEVPRPRATATAPTRSGCSPATRSINGEAPVVVMTTEVLRNMIYAGSPTLREPRLRRHGRGALPGRPVPRRRSGRR